MWLVSEFSRKFVFSGFFYIFAEILFFMKTFRVYYQPPKSKLLCALIPAQSVKQALTRFNAAGFEGEIRCVQDSDFDSTLFNF